MDENEADIILFYMSKYNGKINFGLITMG